jgi:hypothetical protein
MKPSDRLHAPSVVWFKYYPRAIRQEVALAEFGKLLCVDEPLPKDAEPEGSPRSLAHSRSELSTSYPPSGPDRLKLAYSTLVRALSELTVGSVAVRTKAEKLVRLSGGWRLTLRRS